MSALVDTIHRLADVWWLCVLHGGWQSALVGCGLLAVVALAKRWPSPVRYWLLVLALVKFAVPPLWSAPVGVFSYVTVAPGNSPTAVVENGRYHRLGAPRQWRPVEPTVGDNPRQSAAQLPPNVVDEIPNEIATTPRVDSPMPETGLFASRFSDDWKSWLMVLHFVGAAVILGWVVVQFAVVRRVIARAQPIAGGPIAESLDRIRAWHRAQLGGRLGLRRPARVLVSRDVTAPLLVGAVRPAVVLPESAAQLSGRELDAVLVHELTHLRRGDAWIAWIQVVLCSVWWFHPVIWVVNRSLRRVREDCCDDVILLSGVATDNEYCDTLLRVARNAVLRPGDLLACHMANRLHPLGDRIRRIMDARVRRSLRMSAVEIALVALLACLILPGLGRSADGQQANAPIANGAVVTEQAAPPANREKEAEKTQSSGKSGSSFKSAKVPAVSNQRLSQPSSLIGASNSLAQPVRDALALGRRFLASNANANGSIGSGTSASGAYSTGPTALAVVALLTSGTKTDDPTVINALRFLRSSSRPGGTYEVSLMIMALIAANKWEQDRLLIASLAQTLEETQTRAGTHRGMWNYGRLRFSGRVSSGGTEDNSNTQFAVLALREAAIAGVPIEPKTWELAAEHFLNTQNVDGGWGYQIGMQSTGSMTCAGITSLAICDRILTSSANDLNTDGTTKDCNPTSKYERAIRRGLAWLDRYFSPNVNPGQRTWLLYYLCGVERTGRLTRTRFFGRHDWYQEAAKFLVDGQSRRDGSWNANFSFESDRAIATSYCLVFLSKGMTPVLINKLRYGSAKATDNAKKDSLPSCNLHPYDAANLTDYVSSLLNWPRGLKCEEVDFSGVVDRPGIEDAPRAPVLYISGSERPALGDKQVQMLRSYVAKGGLIFAVNNCQSAAFDAGIRELAVRISGEMSLKRLPPDHAVYQADFSLDANGTELWGADFKGRTAFIYVPADLSCLWAKWSEPIVERPKWRNSQIFHALQVGANVAAYAVDNQPHTTNGVPKPGSNGSK